MTHSPIRSKSRYESRPIADLSYGDFCIYDVNMFGNDDKSTVCGFIFAVET